MAVCGAPALVATPTDAREPACCACQPGLRGVLGEPAWNALPDSVQERFCEPVRAVAYTGVFEVVRASLAGRLLAILCQLIGTPVVPRTGRNIPAQVHVGPAGEGARWLREYRWPDASTQRVVSTKVIGRDGTLVERLPARLCMQLQVRERGGVLHFVSQRYYFEVPMPFLARSMKLVLPGWLSPGTTHVMHENMAQGWFRFTMTVTHPWLGELFHQSGCFHAPLRRKTCTSPLR